MTTVETIRFKLREAGADADAEFQQLNRTMEKE